MTILDVAFWVMAVGGVASALAVVMERDIFRAYPSSLIVLNLVVTIKI